MGAAPPLITSVSMGYGHLRAAWALADAAGTEVVLADDPVVVGSREARLWELTRRGYEAVTRLSQVPRIGGVFKRLVDAATEIPPPDPELDLSRPEVGGRLLRKMIAQGLGAGPARMARDTGRPLLTTFYAQAIAAEHHGAPRVACVVTDADIHRIWAPVEPRRTRIVYLVPSQRAAQRLRAYGVPADRIRFTGFPLPPELLGGDRLAALESNLARRLVRLDPRGAARRRLEGQIGPRLGTLPEEEAGRPLHLVAAIGGAGAQTAASLALLRGLGEAVRQGRLRLTLVAGIRAEVAGVFRAALRTMDLPRGPDAPVQVLYERDFRSYYRRFNRTLAHADVLWTKPSEMTFYAGLGLPLLLSEPVGRHEAYNRRWALDRGAGLVQRAPGKAWGWLREWLDEGVLADAAWAGYRHLPHRGTYRVLEAVQALR